MLLRPLMTNPRRRSSLPTAGAYAIGATLYDVAYAAGASLTYKARRAGFLYESSVIKLEAGLSGDAHLALSDPAPSGQKYQLYPGSKKGLLATPSPLTVPATPAGASRLASILGNGDLIFANSNNTGLYAAAGSRSAGPLAVGGGTGIISTGDAVMALSNTVVPDNLFVDGSANDNNQGTYRFTTINQVDMSPVTVATSLTSAGLTTLALGLPPWASAQSSATLVRAFSLTWSPAIRFHGRGYIRVPAVLSLIELYDDGEIGAMARYGNNYPYNLPVHSLRIYKSSVVGLAVISGTNVTFEAHAANRGSSTILATRDPSIPTKWSGASKNSNGTYGAGGNVNYGGLAAPFAPMTPLLLTDKGMISSSYVANSGVVGSPATASVIYSDGQTAASNRGVTPNSATQLYAIPGLDALVSHNSVGFGQPPKAYVSVDLGKSWQGPVPVLLQALGTSAPSAGNPVSYDGGGPYPVSLMT